MFNTLQNWTFEQFQEDNNKGLAGAYRGSEWRAYNLVAISTWISMRDDYTYTDEWTPGNWERLDIKQSHSKYGINYIFLDHERKLWRIHQTASEFYGY